MKGLVFSKDFIGRVLQKIQIVQAVQKWSEARRAKTEERGIYGNTSRDAVCSATQQMSVF
jgi:hypothetical protein